MSFDLRLLHRCPHLTIEETVSLGGDRKSLVTSQPIASTNIAVLFANGVAVPPGGLQTTARLVGSTSGPFTLTENEDDLTISTPEGTFTHSFGVTGKQRLTTDQVIKSLQIAEYDLTDIVNSKGYLELTETSIVGGSSYVKVTGGAASTLGFGNAQYQARGRDVYPSWQLFVPTSFTDLATGDPLLTQRYPKFNAEVRQNPIFKVTYAAPRRTCLRCGGLFNENDFRYDEAGNLVTIENENLLNQAALKIILTVRGSNPYHPFYGTTIKDMIGAKALGAVSTVISNEVRTALSNLVAIQKEQRKYQQVTGKELLFRILSVKTTSIEEDPTSYVVDVVVQNASSDPISLTVPFASPDVIALIQASQGTLSVNELAQAGLL